jgi:hypothetical protein
MEGNTIFSGIPGNPAPLPTSRTGPDLSIKDAIASESRKCNLTTATGSEIEVRLNVSFHCESSAK